jgi:hypothetical protein
VALVGVSVFGHRRLTAQSKRTVTVALQVLDNFPSDTVSTTGGAPMEMDPER